jgi:type I restriction enzyme R subunit
MKEIPPKLRAIADAYLVSRGIDEKVPPISILDEEFGKEVGKRGRTKTKAAEVEHAIRHHLDVELDDDPDLKASFAEALAMIFEEFRENWKKIYEELEKLRHRIIAASKEPTYGLHRKKQMPFFRMLDRELFGDGSTEFSWPAPAAITTATYEVAEDERISKLVDLTQQVYLAVEREVRLTGFWESIAAGNKLRAELQEILLSDRFRTLPGIVKNRKQIISRIMELAQKNNDVILYAE